MVVSKLIWLELDFNRSHVYLEKRSLNCQYSMAVGSNVTVRSQSLYGNSDTTKWTNMSMFQ